MEARKTPSPKNSLTFFMKDRTDLVEYEKAIVKLEKKIEKSLIKMFSNLDINAIVKTDRYSLPYTDEVIHTGFGESYLNAAFESAPFKRKVLSRVLTEDLYKLRFYVFAEIEDHFPMGKVYYYFRYYKH
jgi:hypothetical protein